jgi:hypothetical protein
MSHEVNQSVNELKMFAAVRTHTKYPENRATVRGIPMTGQNRYTLVDLPTI